VLAGINGAGKSSGAGAYIREAGGDYYNPDEFTRSLLAQYPGMDPGEANSLAWTRGKELLERAIAELRVACCHMAANDAALDALGDFPEPGFDLEEIADAQNLEIHFVDSSGIISWEFLRATPDFEFADWDVRGGVGKTTEEEFAWLCEAIHADGRDIYIADFPHLGVYACRILVPSMSEIYPIDDLEWNNNMLQARVALKNLGHGGHMHHHMAAIH
jgi:ribosomal protein S12 methylthiotransferase accessory factor YcaO